ncbi:hypothetical protein CHUAL_012434 [Chamberlinius hualienensis]
MADEFLSPELALKRQCELLLGNNDIYNQEFAIEMDKQDKLASFRSKFTMPTLRQLPCVDHELVNDLDRPCIYLAGHSLGLKPKLADVYMKESLDAWGQFGVMSHWLGPLPAASCDLPGRKQTAKLVGADESEVVLMNGLTVNLNLLLLEFYQPDKNRHIILMEDKAFSSDTYAAKSNVRFHGFDPSTSILIAKPRKDEHIIRTEDILKIIEEKGDEIAVILFAGVQCISGQKFDMKAIAEAGHKKGCIVLFDLAHAIGNVKIELDKWDVDCACWCSYKYLNSGAGGMAGLYVNKKHFTRKPKHLLGWWGNRAQTRFEMREDIDMDEGPMGFRISNPPPWTASLNMASLKIFEETSMEDLLAKQFLLTGYLEALILHYWPQNESSGVKIISPSDPNQRGNQLSLTFNYDLMKVKEHLDKIGIIVDERPPNVMRVTSTPLYTTFQDVYQFIVELRNSLANFS